MRMMMVIATAAIALGLGGSPLVTSQEPAALTKATFLVTGLHCPPCASTVQDSLAFINGIKFVSVDWDKKQAKVEFDERVLPAQALAAAIERTPHMMGSGMRYTGWLAVKAPSLTDEARGQKLREALGTVRGIRLVAVYPPQRSAAILFDGSGTTSSRDILEALARGGIEASNY